MIMIIDEVNPLPLIIILSEVLIREIQISPVRLSKRGMEVTEDIIEG